MKNSCDLFIKLHVGALINTRVLMEIQEFWSSIWILLHNFHAVNRKLFACLLEDIFKISQNINELTNAINIADFDCGIYERCTVDEFKSLLESEPIETQGFVIKQKLLTKKFQQNISTISVIDFTSNSIKCHFLNGDLDDFCIKYENGEVILQALTRRNARESSDRWLEYVLKPKLYNWAKGSSKSNIKAPTVKSLQLIDVEAYNDLYKKLKTKYAESLKQIWLTANESTDPLKFIFEDLAIAAYLICLWKSANSVTFADLGCGNGLLVYVLNEEGFSGYGYDLRRRKLWSLYNDKVQCRLFEAAIVPDDDKFSLPLEVNWLIGNHSDELSAWLPVLAALRSFDTSYFLLPCCAFEFSGAKFQRRNAKLSTYQDFFGYAREISNNCGFNTLEDRLKIPSTKRLALIGCTRNYESVDFKNKCIEIRKYYADEMQRFPHAAGEDVNIKLREKAEPVRNCTKIDRNILSALVQKIFKLLLASNNSICTPVEDIRWQAGGQLTLLEIVKSLSQGELKQLKAECGGVKTLLRNKHEIFQFNENGICLRKPEKRANMLSNNVKRRNCYFHENHPDGCPLTESDCSFLHPNNESR